MFLAFWALFVIVSGAIGQRLSVFSRESSHLAIRDEEPTSSRRRSVYSDGMRGIGTAVGPGLASRLGSHRTDTVERMCVVH